MKDEASLKNIDRFVIWGIKTKTKSQLISDLLLKINHEI